jgi:hypothetical protein
MHAFLMSFISGSRKAAMEDATVVVVLRVFGAMMLLHFLFARKNELKNVMLSNLEKK